MRDPLSRSQGGLYTIDEPPPLPDYVSAVIDSRRFQSSPALRALLLFLWCNRHEQISEYAIATEALGRSSVFDAKTDATVRVQISRLRQRLEKFYEEEGRAEVNRIRIPLGSHQLCVDRAPVEAEPIAAATVQPQKLPSGNRVLIVLLCAACALLLIACAVMEIKLRGQTIDAKAISPQLAPRFWNSFYGNGLTTRIILPTPVFFAYETTERQGTIMVRDTHLNDYSNWASSAPLRLFNKLLGTPQLAQSYTVTSDTFAGIKLVRYLDGFRFPTTVHSSADAVLESLDSENMVAIGTGGTLSPLSPYLAKMNFKLTQQEELVENERPLPGEPKSFSRISESIDRTIWPGVIAVLPGQNGRSHLLIIGGHHTSALVSFLTTTDGLAQLEQVWRSKGSPEFYELVVNAEINGESTTPVRVWALALHPVKKASEKPS